VKKAHETRSRPKRLDDADQCQHCGHPFPTDNPVLEHGLHKRRMDRTPHAMVAVEGRIHQQNVVYKLIIRSTVGQVIEDDQRVVERNDGEQENLCQTQNHFDPFSVEKV
jgi:hypothetical protein